MAAFAVQHLYSVTPPSPPDEIRRVTQSVSLVYVGFYAIVVLENSGFLTAGLRHRAFIAGWLLSVTLVPMLRVTGLKGDILVFNPTQLPQSLGSLSQHAGRFG